MRTATRSGLIPILVWQFLLVSLVWLLPESTFCFILALPALLISPGYFLLLVLFPRKGQLGSIERAVLSLGSSIAIVALLGIAINYTPWGITVYSILAAVSLYLLATAIAAWYFQGRLPIEERFVIGLSGLPKLGSGGAGRFPPLFLAVAVIGALAISGFTVAFPPLGERFTEFYVVNSEGKAVLDLRTVTLGNELMLRLGVTNREGRQTSYTVETRLDGEPVSQLGPFTLENDQEWGQAVSLVPNEAGNDQKVEFLLFKEGEQGIYRSLSLWLNVREEDEKFSEFYVVFLARHPTERLHGGHRYQTTVGVENHEGEETSYRAEMWIIGAQGTQKLGEVGPFSVPSEASREVELIFSSQRQGMTQTAIFLLFKGEDREPDASFRLPIGIYE